MSPETPANNRFANQLTVGAILSLVAWVGIYTRSFTVALMFLPLALILLGAAAAVLHFNSKEEDVRKISRFACAFLGFGGAMLLARTVDQFYFFNAETYPSSLTLGTVSSQGELEAIRENPCEGRIDVVRKANGAVLIRCDAAMRPRTYVAAGELAKW